MGIGAFFVYINVNKFTNISIAICTMYANAHPTKAKKDIMPKIIRYFFKPSTPPLFAISKKTTLSQISIT